MIFEVGAMRASNPGVDHRKFDHVGSYTAEDTNSDGVTDTARPSAEALTRYEAKVQDFATCCTKQAPELLRLGLDRRNALLDEFVRKYTTADAYSEGYKVFRDPVNPWTSRATWLGIARNGYAKLTESERAFATLVAARCGGIPVRPGTYVNQDNLDRPSTWTPIKQALYDYQREQEAQAAAAKPIPWGTVLAVGGGLAAVILAIRMAKKKKGGRS